MKKILYIMLVLILSGFTLKSQSEGNVEMRVFTKYANGKVMVRIAPQKGQTWLLGADKGYNIYRREVAGNQDFVKLNDKPIKPLKGADFDKIENGDSLRVFNQKAIFDNIERLKAPMDIYEKVGQIRKLQDEYAFYFLAITRFKDISGVSGLEFEDKTAMASKIYEYKVELAGLDPKKYSAVCQLITIDEPLPMPDLVANKGDRKIRLNWYHESGNNVLLCYLVEKSVDGKNFEMLTEEPLYFNPDLADNDSTGNFTENFIYHSDSVKENYVPVYYRLTAIDMWSDEHVSQQVTMTHGVDLTPPPTVSMATYSTDEKLKTITWKWNYNQPADFNGYFIYYSTDVDGRYELLTPDFYSKDSTSYTLTKVAGGSSNYLRIAAFDTAGNYSLSVPFHAWINDVDPPETPQNFRAVIDNDGVVTFTWDELNDNLKGYRIFGSNTIKGDLLQVNQIFITGNKWTDTIAVKNSSPNKYYCIAAYDLSFNMSAKSEMIKVVKPDFTKPVAGRLNSVVVVEAGIEVSFNPSSSTDVVENTLLYREDGKETWVAIKNVGKTERKASVALNQGIYEIAISSKDSSGNVSDLSESVWIDVPKRDELVITEFVAKEQKKSVELTWKSSGLAKQYIIYKSEGNDKTEKIIVENSQKYTDNNVEKGKKYSYMIVAQDIEGKMFPFSKAEKVGL